MIDPFQTVAAIHLLGGWGTPGLEEKTAFFPISGIELRIPTGQHKLRALFPVDKAAEARS